MIQLNLLPDVKKEYLTAQRMKRNIISIAILVSIGAVGLTLLLAAYVHGAQRIARNQLQNDITKYSKEVQSIPDINKILTVQGALVALPDLHDQKYLNSRYFEYLKKLVSNDMALTKLDVAQGASQIKLSGQANDYRSLNVFVDTLKNAQLTYGGKDQRKTIDAFSKVTINTAFKSSDPQKQGIEFTLTMSFDPIIFAAKSQEPVMTVPNVTTGQGFIKSNALFSGEREQEGAQQ